MVLTTTAKARMKIQGWVFDETVWEDGIFEQIYRHTHHPGVYFITQSISPGYGLFMSDAQYQRERDIKAIENTSELKQIWCNKCQAWHKISDWKTACKLQQLGCKLDLDSFK